MGREIDLEKELEIGIPNWLVSDLIDLLQRGVRVQFQVEEDRRFPPFTGRLDSSSITRAVQNSPDPKPRVNRLENVSLF